VTEESLKCTRCSVNIYAVLISVFLMIFLYAPYSPAFDLFKPDVQVSSEGRKAARLIEMNPADYPEIMKKLVNVPYIQNRTYFPEKKGLGRGGLPLAVTNMPESGTNMGLFIRDPDTRHGFIYNSDMTVAGSFELNGETPRYVLSLAFPTKRVLMVSGNLPVEKGIFRKGLFQYDWQSKRLMSVLSRDLFYNPASFCFDEETGLTLYHEGRKWIYINMERPRYAVMVYFSPVHPSGVELFRMSYDTGAIRRIFQENKKSFYFLTERDFILSETSQRLWKLSFN